MTKEQSGAVQAESLLEDLGFDCLPISVNDFVGAISDDDFQVTIESVPFNSPNILGTALGNANSAIIAINNRISDPGRRNFTAAHEAGHVCLHIMAQKRSSFECSKEQFSSQYHDPLEREANGFASGLLLPRNLIKKISPLDVSWAQIDLLRKSTGASREVVIRRLFSLQRSAYALVIHHNGQFRRVVKSDSFGFYINNSPLSQEQIAECEDGKSNALPDDLEATDATDWVETRSKHGEIEEIYKSSIMLENGFVYPLLHYDEDCFTDASIES